MSMTTRHQRNSSWAHQSQPSLDKENEALPLGMETVAEEIDTIDSSQVEVSPAKTHAQPAFPAASTSLSSRSGPGRFSAADNKRKRHADTRRESGASTKRQQVHGPAFDKDKQSLSAHKSSLSVEDIESIFERALSRSITGSPNVKSQASSFRPLMPLITAHSKRSDDQKQVAVALAAMKVQFDVKDYDDLKVQARDKAIRGEISAWLAKDGSSYSSGVAAILDILDKNVSVSASPAKGAPTRQSSSSPLPFAIIVPLHPSAQKTSSRKSHAHPIAKQQLHFPQLPTQALQSAPPAETGAPHSEEAVVVRVDESGLVADEPLTVYAEEAPVAAPEQSTHVAKVQEVGQAASGAALATTGMEEDVVSCLIDAAAPGAALAIEPAETTGAAADHASKSEGRDAEAGAIDIGMASGGDTGAAIEDAAATDAKQTDDHETAAVPVFGTSAVGDEVQEPASGAAPSAICTVNDGRTADVEMEDGCKATTDGVESDARVDQDAHEEAFDDAIVTVNAVTSTQNDLCVGAGATAAADAAKEKEVSEEEAIVAGSSRVGVGSDDLVLKEAAIIEGVAVETDTVMTEAVVESTTAKAPVQQDQDQEVQDVDAQEAAMEERFEVEDDADVGKADASAVADTGKEAVAEMDKEDVSAVNEPDTEGASAITDQGKEDASLVNEAGNEGASAVNDKGKEDSSEVADVAEDDLAPANVNPEGTQVVSASEEPKSQPDAITMDEDADEASPPKEDTSRIPSATIAMMTPPTAAKPADGASEGAGKGQSVSRMTDLAAAVELKGPAMESFASPLTRTADPFEAQKIHELNEMEREYVAALKTLSEKERMEKEAIEKHAEIERRLLLVQQQYQETLANMRNTRRDRIVADVIVKEQAEELQQGMRGLGQLMSSFEQERSRMDQLAATMAKTSRPPA